MTGEYTAHTDFSQLKKDALKLCTDHLDRKEPEAALTALLEALYYELSGCIHNYMAFTYALQGIYSKKELKALFVCPYIDPETVSLLQPLAPYYQPSLADSLYSSHSLPLCVCTVEDYKQILEELFTLGTYNDKKWNPHFKEVYKGLVKNLELI